MSVDHYTDDLQHDPDLGVFRASASIDHVLIIEDQSLIAMMMEDYLRELGYLSFAFATSEAEAIDAAKMQCPDLITADVQLCPGSGIDAVQQICALKSIPVLYVTGTADLVRQRCGDAALIEKPFGLLDLMSGVCAAYTFSDQTHSLPAS